MDNSNLKKLFTYSKVYRKIQNDSNESRVYMDSDGKEHEIKSNGVRTFPSTTIGYELANNDILKLSDNSVTPANYEENVSELIMKYNDVVSNEKFQGLKKFLNYHYKNTKLKREFIDFIKYYIKQKPWISYEKREKYSVTDIVIEDWISSKEKYFNIRKKLIIVIPFLTALILGIVFVSEYRALIIGAIVAIFSTQFIKLMDNIMK